MTHQSERVIDPVHDPIVAVSATGADPLPEAFPLAEALLRDWRQPTAERIDRELRFGELRVHPRPIVPAASDGAAVDFTRAQRRALERAPRVTTGSPTRDAYRRWQVVVDRYERERKDAGTPAAPRGPRGKRPDAFRPAKAAPGRARTIAPAPFPVVLPSTGGQDHERCLYGLVIVDEEVLLVPRRVGHDALFARAIAAWSPDEGDRLPADARPVYEHLRALAWALQAAHDRASGRSDLGTAA